MLETSRGHGAAEYLVCEGERLTFEEHFQRVAATAAALRDRYGVGRGDRVAILAENGVEWIVTFWAAVSLGAVVVGLNGWWVRDEILYALGDCDPKLLVADAKRLSRLRGGDVHVPLVRIEEDFAALRAAGYSDRAIVEMVSLTILESGFIRRSRALAPFEDGAQWPKENLPSATYAANVDSRRS